MVRLQAQAKGVVLAHVRRLCPGADVGDGAAGHEVVGHGGAGDRGEKLTAVT